MTCSKYSKVVDFKFENFPNCIPRNGQVTRVLEEYRRWMTRGFLGCQRVRIDGQDYLEFGMWFSCPQRLLLQLRYKLFIFNKNETSEEEVIRETWGTDEFAFRAKSTGLKSFADLIPKKNGFVENGILTIRVEISLDVVTGADGIRRFNLIDQARGDEQWIGLNMEKGSGAGINNLNAHKQILTFHAPSLAENNQHPWNLSYNFLQALHGTQLYFQKSNEDVGYKRIVRRASEFKVFNVRRIFELKIIQSYQQYDNEYWELDDALNYDLRSLLKLMLAEIESAKDLKEALEHRNLNLDAKGISTEIGKMLIEKFFSFD